MNRFLTKIIWFIGFVLLLNLLYVFLLLTFSPGFKKIKDISNLENKNYDLIVLGNSMALDGIDAEYLTNKGVSTYNFAVAGSHVSTSLMIIEEYLKKNKKPKMVLVGLSSAIGQSYLNPIPYTNPEVEFFYHQNLFGNLTNPPLLNFQWLAVDLLKILISKEHREAKMVLGQWKTKKMISDKSKYSSVKLKLISYDDKYLLGIVNLCKESNIKIVFIEIPGSKNNQNNFPSKLLVELKNGYTQSVYNLNNKKLISNIINPSNDWLSQDHLNQNGATKLTAYIHKFIIEKEINVENTIQFNQ
jgi:hypothetical protein